MAVFGVSNPFMTRNESGANSNLGTALAVSNLASGGNIGTAANTVDGYNIFLVNQTTASQAITLPNPTDTVAGRMAFVVNTGSQSFTMYSVAIAADKLAILIWDGSVWNINI